MRFSGNTEDLEFFRSDPGTPNASNSVMPVDASTERTTTDATQATSAMAAAESHPPLYRRLMTQRYARNTRTGPSPGIPPNSQPTTPQMIAPIKAVQTAYS
ncbi:hypothetical protein BV210_19430 (plasmid) [Halorientalis sp. IM1011]|nr:hypothetical protein BV210_19430 [Halorientalis sp. IM1011]